MKLSKKENAKLILDFFHRTMMHHAMWFAEVQHQMGTEKAYKILEEAWEKSYSVQMSRIAKILDFEVEDNIPAPFLNLANDKLVKLREAMAVNWLANDGIWFQAVEFNYGMNDAKRCNDSCWAHFSPFEAISIKSIRLLLLLHSMKLGRDSAM